MKKLSNTKAELKKRIAYKESVYFTDLLSLSIRRVDLSISVSVLPVSPWMRIISLFLKKIQTLPAKTSRLK